jgi:acetyl-CoA decarbonylase/synthase, CODH/ACS complex subunit delta
MAEDDGELVRILLELLSASGEVELQDIAIAAEELTVTFEGRAALSRLLAEELAFAPPEKLCEVEYHPPVRTYPGSIVEVTLGAGRADGGTRRQPVIIGGERAPAFHTFQEIPLHPPVIAGSIFDTAPPLPAPVRAFFGDALNDPCEWAKLWVKKYGADLVDLDLTSTDPYIRDTPVGDAARLVEDLLQAVDVPIIIGGSGNPQKDAQVLPRVAEVCEGERVLLSSATLDMWKPLAEAAKKHSHLVLAWSPIDINQAKELNRNLAGFIPASQIIMDPTSAALGYGLEYAYSVIERIRLAALMGDKELQSPQAAGTANSWGAREAWKTDPTLGPRELRGPMWELTGSLAYLLAGVDLFIMLHPGAVRTVKDIVGWLSGGSAPPTFRELIGVGK